MGNDNDKGEERLPIHRGRHHARALTLFKGGATLFNKNLRNFARKLNQ